MEVSYLIFGAIFLSIALGYVLNINIGLFAMGFAYLIGAFVLEYRVRDIVAMWPTNLFFVIMAITFFYGFAISNGTIEKIARNAVYASRKAPSMLPIVLYFLVTTISAIGPGSYAVFVFLSPLVMAVAAETGMSRLLAAVIVVAGGVAGTFTQMSIGGGIASGLIEKAGYVQNALDYTAAVSRNAFVSETIIFFISYFLLKGYKINKVNFDKPAPFDKKQLLTCLLIFVTLSCVMLPPVISSLFPTIKTLAFMKRQMDPTFVSIIAVVLCLLLKLGNEKDAIAKVPWSVIILLCGMGVLIEVAVKVGTIKALAAWMSTHVSADSAPLVLGAVASVMSFFSSTMGVVMPTLYPLVPELVNSVGADPATLFSIITVCAAFTGFSPFSSGGALSLTGVSDEGERKKLFNQLLVLPVDAMALALTLTAVGIIH